MKIKGLILYTLFNLLFTVTLFAQEKNKEDWCQCNEVNNFDYRFGYTFLPHSKDTLTNYVLPKSVYGHKYAVEDMVFQYDQYTFIRYKQKKITKEILLNKVLGIDTSKMMGRAINNYVSTLVYIDATYKYLIFDTNFNKDFTDDKVYSFKIADIEYIQKEDHHKYAIKLNVPLQYVLNGNVINLQATTFVLPFPPSRIRLLEKDELYYCFTLPDIMRECNYKEISIFLKKSLPDTTNRYQVNIVGDNGQRSENDYKVKEKFSFKDRPYIIDSIDLVNNRIRILNEESLVNYGTEKTFYFDRKISGENQDKKPISVKGYKGNYLLIDFWATWCIPCIEALPDLKMLYEKYKNKKFTIVSVSVDDVKEFQRAKKYAKDHKVAWDVMLPNINNNKESQPFTNNGIPYFVLLNPEGKILFSEGGTDSLPNLIKELKSIFKD